MLWVLMKKKDKIKKRWGRKKKERKVEKKTDERERELIK